MMQLTRGFFRSFYFFPALFTIILPSHSQDTTARSVGTMSAYTTGTATSTTGSAVVNFSGATISDRVGEWDRLIIDVNGTPDTSYILSRNSSAQVTLQNNAPAANTDEDFRIERAYDSLYLWEAAEKTDLIALNTIAKAVCYNDGQSDNGAGVWLDADWQTSQSCFIWIYVPPAERHTGKVGTGK